MKHQSLISLGANQHDPRRQIQLARNAIQALPHTYIQADSPIIMTEALGYVRQQDYYNQILVIATRLSPLALLDHLQAIEQRLGRVRRIPWGPRMIDLDILSYGTLTLHHPRLQLPHPQLTTRPFIQILIKKCKILSNKTSHHL